MKPAILFNHIYKTGGTTFFRAFGATHGKEAVVMAWPNPAPIHWIRKHLAGRNDKPSMIVSHDYLMLHRYRRELAHPTVLFTILRDPVDRVVSQYLHYRRSDTNGWGKLIREKNLSLKDFVSKARCHEMHNWQTKALCWGRPSEYLPSETTVDTETWHHALVSSIRSLQLSYICFGIMERMEETFRLFSAVTGIHLPPALAGQRTNAGQGVQNVTAADLEAVRRFNGLDLELYAKARSWFDTATTSLGTRPESPSPYRPGARAYKSPSLTGPRVLEAPGLRVSLPPYGANP